MRFISGFGIGVLLGLFYAPASGKATRRRLIHEAEELSDLPERKAAQIAEMGKAKAGEMGAEIGRQAAEAAVQAVTDTLMQRDRTA